MLGVISHLAFTMNDMCDSIKRITLPFYRVSKEDIRLADLEEFLEFASHFVEHGEGYMTYRPDVKSPDSGAYVIDRIGSHDVTMAVTEPKTNPKFPKGRIELICYEGAQTFAVFPYRFRGIPVETIVKTILPHIDFEIMPTHGTRDYQEAVSLKRSIAKAKYLSGFRKSTIKVVDNHVFVYGTEDGCFIGVRKYNLANLQLMHSLQ